MNVHRVALQGLGLGLCREKPNYTTWRRVYSVPASVDSLHESYQETWDSALRGRGGKASVLRKERTSQYTAYMYKRTSVQTQHSPKEKLKTPRQKERVSCSVRGFLLQYSWRPVCWVTPAPLVSSCGHTPVHQHTETGTDGWGSGKNQGQLTELGSIGTNNHKR